MELTILKDKITGEFVIPGIIQKIREFAFTKQKILLKKDLKEMYAPTPEIMIFVRNDGTEEQANIGDIVVFIQKLKKVKFQDKFNLKQTYSCFCTAHLSYNGNVWDMYEKIKRELEAK